MGGGVKDLGNKYLPKGKTTKSISGLVAMFYLELSRQDCDVENQCF